MNRITTKLVHNAVACTVVCAMAIATNAYAQPPGGGPGRGGPGGPGGPGGRGGGPSIEQIIEAVKLQAHSVADHLGVDAPTADRIATAYGEYRTNIAMAMPRRGEGGGRPDMQELRATLEAERTKLNTALAAFLTAEQATEATSYLGTFSRDWDRMVLVIDEMGLEGDAKKSVNESVLAYVLESSKAREAAMQSGDFQSIRETMEQQRQALNTNLQGVLSAEQMTKWQQATERRRGGRGDGPGGPRGPRGDRDGEGPRGPRGDGPRGDGPPPRAEF